MAHRKSGRSIWWWLPLICRVLLWGVSLLMFWGWLPFLCSGPVASYWLQPDNGQTYHGQVSHWKMKYDDLILVLVTIGFVHGCLLMVVGGITGALTGFYARAAEPLNPLRSSIFKSVGRNTFWFWLCSSFSLNIIFLLLYKALFFLSRPSLWQLATYRDPILLIAYLLASISVFVFGAWRALNQAFATQSQGNLRK